MSVPIYRDSLTEFVVALYLTKDKVVNGKATRGTSFVSIKVGSETLLFMQCQSGNQYPKITDAIAQFTSLVTWWYAGVYPANRTDFNRTAKPTKLVFNRDVKSAAQLDI